MRGYQHCLVVLGLTLLGAAEGSGQSTGAAKPAGGPVSPVQARRGETAFNQSCSACHTTAQFNSEAFAKTWNERPIIELFEQLRSSMPQDNPGRLTREEYLDVVLYLFKLNGAAEGVQELAPTEEVLRATKIKLKVTN